jgi:hypothetical protein
MRSRILTPGDIVILGAGVLMLVGSFLPFYKAETAAFFAISTQSWNAWSTAENQLLFPIATLVVLFGIAMAAHVALTTFSVDLPRRPLGFTWDQIHLVLGFHATIIMFAFLLRDPTFPASIERSIGMWLMLLAAIGLLVGGVLRTIEGNAPPRRR